MSISRYYFQLKNVLQIQKVFGLKKPVLFTALSALNNLSGDQINIENIQTYRLIFYSFLQWGRFQRFDWRIIFLFTLFDQSKRRKRSIQSQQEAEAAWKLTTIKKNLTCESNFWIDFRTMRS